MKKWEIDTFRATERYDTTIGILACALLCRIGRHITDLQQPPIWGARNIRYSLRSVGPEVIRDLMGQVLVPFEAIRKQTEQNVHLPWKANEPVLFIGGVDESKSAFETWCRKNGAMPIIVERDPTLLSSYRQTQNVTRADAEWLPLKPESLHGIVGNSFIQCTEKKSRSAIYDEMCAALKPGGWIYLPERLVGHDWTSNSTTELVDRLKNRGLTLKRRARLHIPIKDCTNLHPFNEWGISNSKEITVEYIVMRKPERANHA
ncbi:MAG: class I SAM-dependent methyltransferase [bacterium]